jgi:hypothetical protein
MQSLARSGAQNALHPRSPENDMDRHVKAPVHTADHACCCLQQLPSAAAATTPLCCCLLPAPTTLCCCLHQQPSAAAAAAAGPPTHRPVWQQCHQCGREAPVQPTKALLPHNACKATCSTAAHAARQTHTCDMSDAAGHDAWGFLCRTQLVGCCCR